MKAKELRTRGEKRLFFVCATLSILLWAVLIVSVVGILFGLLVGFLLFIARALMIAHMKGHAVRTSEEQLPELYKKVVEASARLGLPKAPEVYVMQAGGALNAFATKFIGRRFVVIFSDLLEACEEGREADMIIGHEIGHLALGHLRWLFFLAPARAFPLLGPAYSRACEYSCDLCGLEVAGETEVAVRGLAVLAAGGKYGRKVDQKAFARQVQENCGFWASIYELNASHPFLPRRVAALLNHRQPGSVSVPSRNPLAYPFAPFLGVASPGAAAAPLAIVAVVGILAAVAIPQYQAYRSRAEQTLLWGQQGESDESEELEDVDVFLAEAYGEAAQYFARANAWPCSFEEFASPELREQAARNDWEPRVDCDDKTIAVSFPVGAAKHYRLIRLETGETEEGILNE